MISDKLYKIELIFNKITPISCRCDASIVEERDVKFDMFMI